MRRQHLQARFLSQGTKLTLTLDPSLPNYEEIHACHVRHPVWVRNLVTSTELLRYLLFEKARASQGQPEGLWKLSPTPNHSQDPRARCTHLVDHACLQFLFGETRLAPFLALTKQNRQKLIDALGDEGFPLCTQTPPPSDFSRLTRDAHRST